MYFERFPKGQYIQPGTQTFKLVSDLFRRIKIRDKVKDVASLYSEYFVTNGERPEHIAHKHFGSPQLHWVVLLSNNIRPSPEIASSFAVNIPKLETTL